MDGDNCPASRLKRPLDDEDDQLRSYQRQGRELSFSEHVTKWARVESQKLLANEPVSHQDNVAGVSGSNNVLMSGTLGLVPQTSKPQMETSEDFGDTICYGMICDSKAAFLDGFDLVWDAFTAFLTPAYSADILTISHHGGAHRVRHERLAVDIAILDSIISKILHDISKVGAVTIQAFLDSSAELPCLLQNACDKPPMFQVLLVLYGAKATSNAIGKILSRARVYLQHPITITSDIKYDNPHYYKTTKGMARTNLSHAYIGAPTIQLDLSPRSDIERIVQSLEQDTTLRELEPDSRIKTELLPHQKEALDFILQRERNVLTETLSLWKFRPLDNGSFYQHSITGLKSESHAGDPRGGILADEMGLGKTLSIISAIITTLEEANLYRLDCIGGPDTNLQSKATLVIAPSAVLLDGWAAEIKRHVQEDTLRIHKYHGQGKKVDFQRLLDYDVIFTTFATLSAECSKGSSSLQNINWFRLVLDEVHFLRNQSTKQFKAVLSLEAQRRWLLSGTPVQNCIEDIQALIRLLRVPELQTRSKFQEFIVAPLAEGTPNASRNIRLLLNSSLDLSSEERTLYDNILTTTSREIEEAISSKKSFEAYSSIIRGILRTRMLCNHGTFRRHQGTSRLGTPLMENQDALVSMQDGDEELDLTIGNCSTNIDSPSETNPCKEASSMLLSSTSATIPTGHSTKLCALLKNLKDGQSKEKSIIFSCWKVTLDLVGTLLRSNGIKHARIDGGVTGAERSRCISQFDTDPSIRVMIMTTGTGAVGLNLTIATQVHILEPQWNPSVESQAIGRVLRLTQKKPITVTRYITNDTVEQAVQERQNKKLELAAITLNQEADSDDQLRKRLLNLRSLLYK